MSISKSIFDGLGSASGVAWPLYGLLFTALGLASGGIAAISLSIVCTSLFCTLSTTVFIVTYWQMRQDTKKRRQKLDDKENDVAKQITAYLCQFQQASGDIKNRIKENALNAKNSNTNMTALRIMNQWLTQQDTSEKSFNSTEITQAIHHLPLASPFPFKKVGLAALTGFIAPFGSIAGGGSGLLNVLVTLGLVSSALTPTISLVLLSTALVVSLTFASYFMYNAYHAATQTARIAKFKALSQELTALQQDLTNQLEPTTTPPEEPASSEAPQSYGTHFKPASSPKEQDTIRYRTKPIKQGM
ncbi:MAG: hypothetical protein CMF38_07690 [Legionellaceae bacterium]|nr:hypothetical protein [Legionellaceae bacterium]MBJ16495.1 hypothetical protein [Legionellaceae bacterium]HCA89892.1 hypothetical protein [Legionellales bacterium]